MDPQELKDEIEMRFGEYKSTADSMKENTTHFSTGAVRDTGGKGRMDLIPWCAILRASRHMENSLANYPERNWEKGLPMHSMIDSAMRHLAKYLDGQRDEDHLCAAAVNLLMAMWTEEKMPHLQDIPSRLPPGYCPSPVAYGVDHKPDPIPEAKESTKEGQEEVHGC